MPYKKRYKKRGWRFSEGRVMCAGKQKTATIKTNEKYYSEIDKFHQEAKDKYYSNNSNPAEYEEKYDEEYDEDDEDDEDVALAKAISLSLNIQNKPEESNIEEPVIEESKEELLKKCKSRLINICSQTIVSVSQNEDESSDEFEFPRFFTISGSMKRIDNPINSENATRRNYLNTEITYCFSKKQKTKIHTICSNNRK